MMTCIDIITHCNHSIYFVAKLACRLHCSLASTGNDEGHDVFDGSLAIKNAQKQAMARETVAGSLKPVGSRDNTLAASRNSATGSKAEAGASRFSDFIEDARENEDDRAERLPPAGDRAQRSQADQMRARKATVAGKSVLTRESAERPCCPASGETSCGQAAG